MGSAVPCWRPSPALDTPQASSCSSSGGKGVTFPRLVRWSTPHPLLGLRLRGASVGAQTLWGLGEWGLPGTTALTSQHPITLKGEVKGHLRG